MALLQAMGKIGIAGNGRTRRCRIADTCDKGASQSGRRCKAFSSMPAGLGHESDRKQKKSLLNNPASVALTAQASYVAALNSDDEYIRASLSLLSPP